MPVLKREGETIFVSPYTGQEFTNRFAYNDHLQRWPQIAEANGLPLQPDASTPHDVSVDGMTVQEVLDAVDRGDIPRGVALEAEQARDRPRKTLLEALE